MPVAGSATSGRPARTWERIHILLTHLHLDHIQGLLFFAPFFQPETEIVIWGPPAPGPLAARPHRPLPVRAAVAGRDPVAARQGLVPQVPRRGVGDRVGPHPGRRRSVIAAPRSAFGSARPTRRSATCPTTSPRWGCRSSHVEPDWISGFGLAERCSLLLHDCQYTDEEYPSGVGWGHSRMSDALLFARRSEAERVLLFHHDPLHSDVELDLIHRRADEHWLALGGPPGELAMAIEG